MIDFLASISRKLYWAKTAILILGICLTSLFTFVVVRTDLFDSDIYLIPSMLGSIWAWLFLFLISSFVKVPGTPSKEIGFFKRLKVKFKRVFYWLLCIVFAILSITVVVMSFRLIMIWQGKY